MQGGVLTPLKCSVQIDTIGKETMSISECSKSMFKYKDCVKIPVLSFIDDAISITECGPDSVKANAYIQSKLKLSQSKCFKMHIGNDKTVCPTLKVNEKEMKNSNREKYLGDVITDNAKIDDNLNMRQDKGFGIVNQIVSILKDVATLKWVFYSEHL